MIQWVILIFIKCFSANQNQLLHENCIILLIMQHVHVLYVHTCLYITRDRTVADCVHLCFVSS